MGAIRGRRTVAGASRFTKRPCDVRRAAVVSLARAVDVRTAVDFAKRIRVGWAGTDGYRAGGLGHSLVIGVTGRTVGIDLLQSFEAFVCCHLLYTAVQGASYATVRSCMVLRAELGDTAYDVVSGLNKRPRPPTVTNAFGAVRIKRESPVISVENLMPRHRSIVLRVR